MAILFIILLISVGLAVRAGLSPRRWTIADSDPESGHDSWLIDACARSFVVVLFSLVGLLALGIAYGNVLGAVHTNR